MTEAYFFSRVVGQDVQIRSLVIQTKQNKSLILCILGFCLNVIYKTKVLLIFKQYLRDVIIQLPNTLDIEHHKTLQCFMFSLAKDCQQNG